MNVIKILGESTQVNAGSGSSVPGSVNGSLGAALGAEYVMIQHSHSSDRLVEIRTGAGVTYGSIHMAGKDPIIVYKQRTDLIYSSAADVYATSVVYQG
tara:strand:+ start:232 stop:525 length:294 start_codon:yes stop_codon:yes gene_type:complete